MKNASYAVAALCACLLFCPVVQAESQHRVGGGLNYWVMLDDVDVKDFDDKGLSYLASYQYRMGLLGFEGDLEIMPNRGEHTAVAPQAYVLLGDTIYAGAGVGIHYADGEFADDPFFALKAGLNLELIPNLFTDISVNYRFNKKEDLKDKKTRIDTDTIFLGAAIRFGL